MAKLTCRHVGDIKDFENFPEFIRRTKTVCLWAGDRPDIKSKAIAKITIKANGEEKSDIFCVDARGSKKGYLTAHPSHLMPLSITQGQELEVSVCSATAEECAYWLFENDDPERKAFGLMLQEAIDASRGAKESLVQARLSEENAKAYKERGMVYAVAAFFAGSLLDVGMIESKFGFSIPVAAIVATAILSVLLFLGARKVVGWYRSLFEGRKN